MEMQAVLREMKIIRIYFAFRAHNCTFAANLWNQGQLIVLKVQIGRAKHPTCYLMENPHNMTGKMIICCLLFTLNAAAQGQEATDSISTQESKPNLLVRLHQLQQYLDTKAKAKVDSHYIEVPEKPWRVILRYK